MIDLVILLSLKFHKNFRIIHSIKPPIFFDKFGYFNFKGFQITLLFQNAEETDYVTWPVQELGRSGWRRSSRVSFAGISAPLSLTLFRSEASASYNTGMWLLKIIRSKNLFIFIRIVLFWSVNPLRTPHCPWWWPWIRCQRWWRLRSP